ncbi:HlyD family efflux transporter periplasmic adaptor subunit [Pseudoalteromonas sp. JBTF-M23]|uniref:HlyD family efflux transporter periplasmic adaptor subunit n=1 Tax=Pseudoalteromonas caenipelagi TaxID=2726988 RepID=A0A849VDC2_9GAMM|nr:HlyD family efflux transporter periplasmic adaptor subunit [Pseudoalteromonas caenipelagi]NOU51402.1 HlyD family efflux transporter periplasmic adaptor subunit [Pseudoalteromonas caenipelagi]
MVNIFRILTSLLVLQYASWANAEEALLPGTVYSKTKLQLSAEQSGQLNFILDVGETFQKGDAIARIDNSYEQKQLVQLSIQQQNIKAKIAEHQQIIDGYESLLQSNSVSGEQRAQKHIDLLNSRHELNLIEQEIVRLTHILDKKTINAPYPGVVLQRDVKTFEVVQAGDTLVTVFDPRALYVLVHVPHHLYRTLDLQQAGVAEENSQLQLAFDYLVPEVDVRSSTVEVSFKVTGIGVLLGQALQIKIPKKL